MKEYAADPWDCRRFLGWVPRSVRRLRIVTGGMVLSADSTFPPLSDSTNPLRFNETVHTVNDAYRPNTYAGSYVASPTHPAVFAYLYWILGIFGAHRFYLGRPITGAIWFFTGGLLLVGWIIDLFLIPSMAEDADRRYRNGPIDYTIAWVLHTFLGLFGIHRLYMGKIFTGVLFLLTGGLFGIGYVYDILTLNEQIDELNG